MRVGGRGLRPGGADYTQTRTAAPALFARPPRRNAGRRRGLRQSHAMFGLTLPDAAAVLYLASPEAAYVTGQTLHVNGGMAMI